MTSHHACMAQPPAVAASIAGGAKSAHSANAPVQPQLHGSVFDASGYGQAARDLVHALHAAGVNSRSSTTRQRGQPQIADPLVASLRRPQRAQPIFTCIHGIPACGRDAAPGLRK